MRERDRRTEPIRTATAMALAAHRGELVELIELWNGTEAVDRPGLIEALARLPSVMAQATELHVDGYSADAALEGLVALASAWEPEDGAQ